MSMAGDVVVEMPLVFAPYIFNFFVPRNHLQYSPVTLMYSWFRDSSLAISICAFRTTGSTQGLASSVRYAGVEAIETVVYYQYVREWSDEKDDKRRGRSNYCLLGCYRGTLSSSCPVPYVTTTDMFTLTLTSTRKSLQSSSKSWNMRKDD